MASNRKHNKECKQWEHQCEVAEFTADRKKRRRSSSAATDEKKSRRKRRETSETVNNAAYLTNNQAADNVFYKQVFNGMVLAVSSFNSSSVEGEKNSIHGGFKDSGEHNHYSYKSMVQELKAAGATISSQVHKRIHALIVPNLQGCANFDENYRAVVPTKPITQRIRKALKLNVPIVDVSWVEHSKKEGSLLDVRPYLLNSKAAALATAGNAYHDEEPQINRGLSGKAKLLETSSSTFVSLGCCCACHDSESAVNDCPWCESCR